MTFSLIIVAAGSGSRTGSETPKQFIEIAGKTILEHTLEVFRGIDGLQDVCVVLPSGNHTVIENATTCTGGNTRKESVFNGLKELSNLNNQDVILIHDAARPFVMRSDIESLLEQMKTVQAATLAAPVTDTIRYETLEPISRDNLWALQTPQAFTYDTIKQAHEQADPDKNYTDDTALVSDMGIDVAFVPCGRHNFKITTPDDLAMARDILETYETRTGQGFDVHAFDDVPADTVRLCGIDIPHDKKLKGHSDADVGLHALTDSILGAIGEGDIGLHFPPNDDTFKNMNSAVFLEHAVELLKEKGGELINVDVTLICEAPKLGKHRAHIVSRLSDILNIAQSRINLKATTTEKLGFTGRGEGIAAQAIVTVSLPKGNT